MDDVTVLAAQESELEWTRFGVEEAWALGTAVRALAVERGAASRSTSGARRG